MKTGWFFLFIVMYLATAGIMAGQATTGFLDKYHGEPDGSLETGTYQILAVAQKSDEAVLLVLQDENKPASEPRFHKIKAEDTFNFDTDCCLAGDTVIKVDSGGLEYIKFIHEATER